MVTSLLTLSRQARTLTRQPKTLAPTFPFNPSRRSEIDESKAEFSLIIILFLIGLIIPIIVFIGTIRISPYRIVLLVMFIPCIIKLISGSAGRLRWADFWVFMFCVWITISYISVYPLQEVIEPIGINIIEIFGSYLIARCYIRDLQSFRGFTIIIFIIILALLPFAVYETLTSHNFILDATGKIFNTFEDAYKEPRFGLDRVQGPFEHPILFGVFCGSIVGIVFYTIRSQYKFGTQVILTTFVLATASLALSSGPLTALVGQIFLIAWDVFFRKIKNYWKILLVLFIFAWIFIDIFSNRTPPEVFISYFAFNASTGYSRIAIFHYGMLSILENFWFGVGFNEWENAYYMSQTIDMFWIVHAVKNGAFAGLFMFLAFFSVVLTLVRKTIHNEQIKNARIGIMVSLVGFFLAGWTVHYWNATAALFMFFMGASLWVGDYDDSTSKKARKSVVVPGNRTDYQGVV